jgi:hypothetical protein
MSFERPQKGMLVFCCDACPETIEITEDLSDYNKCWGHAKEEGWRMHNSEHFCPECAELI